MADLPESSEWAPGVYQIETSDPVLGGPEGVTNLPVKQLTNRTNWLRTKIDALIKSTSVPFASQIDAEKGSDTIKPMSALRVFQAIGAQVVQASESLPGIARIASKVMVKAGIDNRSIVTPETLAALFPYRGRVVYGTPGVYPWDVPSGVVRGWVVVIGAGGGGGRSASAPGPTGGGYGGVSKKLVDLRAITRVTVTVGKGGDGALHVESNGTGGGTSSFGTYVSASGGGGGRVNDFRPNYGYGTGGDENYHNDQVNDVIDLDVLLGDASRAKGPGWLATDSRKPGMPGQGGTGWRGTANAENSAPGGGDGQVTIQW